MGSPERPKINIIKKAIKSAAVPVAVGIAVASVACSKVYDVQFADCNLDPETKTADRKMKDQTISPPMELKVDGITFRASRRKIDIFSNQPERTTTIKQDDVYSFKGMTDGRIYLVTFDRDSNRWLKNATVVGARNTPSQTKP